MTTPAIRYDGFISYSHSGDIEFSRRLQRELERFAKPWNKIRSNRLFRDESNLTATPGLWSTLEEALAASGWLILMASPESASSEWVNKEVTWWRGHRSLDRLLIVLTGGDIAWDHETGNFDPAKTTALPPALHGGLSEEPLWVDARWARNADVYEANDPRMQRTVVDVAASLRGVDKDLLVGEAAREHRKTRRLTRGAIAALSLLLVLALILSGFAWVQRNSAVAATRVAQSRQLASLAERYMTSDLGLAAAFSVAGHAMDQNAQTEATLMSTALASPQLRLAVNLPSSITNVADCLAPGCFVAGLEDGTVVKWDLASPEVTIVAQFEGGVRSVAVDATATVFAASAGQMTVQVGPVGQLRPISVPATGDVEISEVELTPDGKTVLAVTRTRVEAKVTEPTSIWAIDVDSGASQRIPTPTGCGAELVVAADGSVTVYSSVSESSGCFQRLRADTWEVVSEGRVGGLSGGSSAGPKAHSPDGLFFGQISRWGGNVGVWTSTATGEKEANYIRAGVPRFPGALAVDQGGQRVAIDTPSGIVVAGTTPGSEIMTLGGTGARKLQFTTDGMLVSAYGSQLQAWDFGQSSRISNQESIYLGASCLNCLGPTLAVSPDGAHVAATGYEGDLATVLDVRDGSHIELPDGSMGYGDPVWSGDSLLISWGSTKTPPSEVPDWVRFVPLPDGLVSTDSGDLLGIVGKSSKEQVLTWYGSDGEVLRSVALLDGSGEDYVKAVAIGENSHVAAMINDSEIEVIDAASLDVVWSISSDHTYSGVTFWRTLAVAGDTVVAVREDGMIDVFGAGGNLTRSIPMGDCTMGAVSRDARWLALTCSDQSVALVSLLSGQRIAQLPGDLGGEAGAAFAPDSDHLAVGREWDNSPERGSITYYDLTADRILAASCAVARLDISADEWASYAPGIPQPSGLCESVRQDTLPSSPANTAPETEKSSPTTEPVVIPTVSVPGTAYVVYTNQRFGYSFQIPAELVPGEPSADGSGQTWTSADGAVTVSVQARATPSTAIAAQLEEFLVAPVSNGWTVTYSASDQDSATVSGHDLAQTMMLYDHVDIGSATTIEFSWQYPTTAAAEVDPWVENSYTTFETGDLTQPQ